MAHITLITGGARSGKSSFAEELVASNGSKIAYIATAQPLDDEMKDRIKRHKQQRPSVWRTFEEPVCPSKVVSQFGDQFDALLLDCLTVLTTNLILQVRSVDWENPPVEQLSIIEDSVTSELNNILDAAANIPARLYCVTNEVGLGIVPDNPLGRFFRDCNGRVNQLMAKAADEVFMVISTIPMQIKG